MSRIVDVAVSLHRLALDPPFSAAWDRQPRHGFPVSVFRVHDDDGRFGFGAGDAMRGLPDYLDLFIGEDPLDLARHSRILDNISFFDGRPWPLELALWDLAGKIRGEPVWRMVGGLSNRLRPYASSGTHWPIDKIDDAVEEVLAGGFAALKLRFGRPKLIDDLAVLERVVERASGRLEVMVDCNQGWRMPWDVEDPWDLETASGVAGVLDQAGVYWMEEPLHRGDIDGMRRLRESFQTRIAGGEMTRQIHELDGLLAAGALDVYQPDAAVTCGIHQLVGFARRVVASGATFSPHTWGSGVALVANAHLTAGTVGTPYLEYPFDPPIWTPERRDFIMQTPFIPDADGFLTLSEAPGLGLVLDEERLASTRTDSVSYG